MQARGQTAVSRSSTALLSDMAMLAAVLPCSLLFVIGSRIGITWMMHFDSRFAPFMNG